MATQQQFIAAVKQAAASGQWTLTRTAYGYTLVQQREDTACVLCLVATGSRVSSVIVEGVGAAAHGKVSLKRALELLENPFAY